MKLQTDLWPTDIVFDKGERLVLKISGHDMRLVDFEMLQGLFQIANARKRDVPLGGEMANYLNLHFLAITVARQKKGSTLQFAKKATTVKNPIAYW